MMTLTGALAAVRGQQRDYSSMKKYITREFPQTVAALRLIDTVPGHREPKGYNLVKRENKKLGYVYYVRYWHEGRMLPSKWCTHTNKKKEAERIAVERREEIIRDYSRRHDGRLYKILNDFYAPYSEYIQRDLRRNYGLSEKNRSGYHGVIMSRFIPFLKENGITSFEQITSGVLTAFQDKLLEAVKPQTVNNYMKSVRRIFRYLVRAGEVKSNPSKDVGGIAVKVTDRKARGCFEIDRLKGVFARRWADEKNRLLCLLIYSTGTRNSEINLIRLDDITESGGSRFLQIRRSKTESGERLVPLHEYVYEAIRAYAAEKNKAEEIFCGTRPEEYNAAAEELGRQLGLSAADLEKEHITFYSGRHFWKTLMSAHELGADIEEIFMGHKVSGDVSKLYNHKDKQGASRLAAKARKACRILDKALF
jgi:site-specific recombinase XerD